MIWNLAAKERVQTLSLGLAEEVPQTLVKSRTYW